MLLEQAVYGSDEDEDSENAASDDDNDDAMSGVSFKTKQTGRSSKASLSSNKRTSKQFIRSTEDDDEPLDLLDPRSMASISSTRRASPQKQAPTR